MINNTDFEAQVWYENLLWKDSIVKIGILDHPKYGRYYIWHDEDGDKFGITKEDKPPHCAYASVEALIKTKGL
jgi:hypothetical protein